MAPKGGRKIRAHFDRAESEHRDAETRAKLSERSEFLARRIMGLKRGDPDGIGTGQTGAFSFVTFLWSMQRKVSLSMNKTCAASKARLSSPNR